MSIQKLVVYKKYAYIYVYSFFACLHIGLLKAFSAFFALRAQTWNGGKPVRKTAHIV